VFSDRGYTGPKKINETNLHTPKPDKNITLKKKKRYSRRAAIEPVIGHLKSDYRMARNYLKGINGDAINVMLSAAAFNFKRVMNIFKKKMSILCSNIIEIIYNVFCLLFTRKIKLTF
jgi:IS5 family transposase